MVLEGFLNNPLFKEEIIVEEFIEQVSTYFVAVPLWPFALLGLLGLIAVFVEIMNRKRRSMALDNFHYTIEKELSGMYPRPVNWPQNVSQYLCDRLPMMQKNFEVLRVFIPQKRLLSYNTAWNNYCDFCRNITDEECIPGNAASDRNEPDPKAVFHRLVSELLAQAKV